MKHIFLTTNAMVLFLLFCSPAVQGQQPPATVGIPCGGDLEVELTYPDKSEVLVVGGMQTPENIAAAQEEAPTKCGNNARNDVNKGRGEVNKYKCGKCEEPLIPIQSEGGSCKRFITVISEEKTDVSPGQCTNPSPQYTNCSSTCTMKFKIKIRCAGCMEVTGTCVTHPKGDATGSSSIRNHPSCRNDDNAALLPETPFEEILYVD